MPVALVSTSILASQAMMNAHIQLTALQNAQFNSQANAAPANAYFIAQAKIRAEEGDEIIERLAFWTALLPVSKPIVSRLADELERVTGSVERSLEKAAA
jgi:hypothetical protein